MEKSTYVRSVEEFHRAFSLPVRDVPQLISYDETQLRLKLLLEEVNEVEEAAWDAEAVNYDDMLDLSQDELDREGLISEVGKELADILYICFGTALVYGIDLDKVFAETHRSNMSKLGPDGKPVYREDKKVLKGPNFSPADIRSVLFPK